LRVRYRKLKYTTFELYLLNFSWWDLIYTMMFINIISIFVYNFIQFQAFCNYYFFLQTNHFREPYIIHLNFFIIIKNKDKFVKYFHCFWRTCHKLAHVEPKWLRYICMVCNVLEMHVFFHLYLHSVMIVILKKIMLTNLSFHETIVDHIDKKCISQWLWDLHDTWIWSPYCTTSWALYVSRIHSKVSNIT